MNLVRNNMAIIHGGVVRIGQQGFLIPSVENTGKTTTVWLLAKHGAQFITDEYSILDRDGQCYGIPGNSSLTRSTANAVGLKLERKTKIRLMLADIKGKILTVHFSSGATSLSPGRFFKMCDKTMVTGFTIIQNGVDFTKKIDVDEALVRIKAIQSLEFGWRSHPYLLAYSYFNPQFDISSLFSREDDLLRAIIASIGNLYLVSSSHREHHRAIQNLARVQTETSMLKSRLSFD